jgi:hypothetical protein
VTVGTSSGVGAGLAALSITQQVMGIAAHCIGPSIPPCLEATRKSLSLPVSVWQSLGSQSQLEDKDVILMLDPGEDRRHGFRIRKTGFSASFPLSLTGRPPHSLLLSQTHGPSL